MGKGFGIAAIVIAVLSTISPVVVNVGAIWIAMICASGAVLGRDCGLALAAAIIGAAGLFLFSPLTLASVSVSVANGSLRLAVLVFAPFALLTLAYGYRYLEDMVAGDGDVPIDKS